MNQKNITEQQKLELLKKLKKLNSNNQQLLEKKLYYKLGLCVRSVEKKLLAFLEDRTKKELLDLVSRENITDFLPYSGLFTKAKTMSQRYRSHHIVKLLRDMHTETNNPFALVSEDAAILKSLLIILPDEIFMEFIEDTNEGLANIDQSVLRSLHTIQLSFLLDRPNLSGHERQSIISPKENVIQSIREIMNARPDQFQGSVEATQEL